MEDVDDPRVDISVKQRRRAMLRVNAESDSEIKEAERADLRIYPMGSGSDYTPFLQHLGIASANLGFGGEGEDGTSEWQTINSATALWQRPRQEISDEEYQNFYRHLSHDFQDALTWSHNKVEGNLEYTSLLYVPGRAPFDLYERDGARARTGAQ